jgi:hypothetical protein
MDPVRGRIDVGERALFVIQDPETQNFYHDLRARLFARVGLAKDRFR